MRTAVYWFSLVLVFFIPCESAADISAVGTVTRAIGLGVAAIWAATVVLRGRVRRPVVFHVAFFLFVLWNVVSIFWSFDPIGTRQRILTYIQTLGLVFILWDLYTTPGSLRAALQAYVLGAYVSVGGAIYNYLGGVQAGYQRYSAFHYNPDGLGFVLVLGIPVALYLSASNDDDKTARILRLVNYIYIPAALLAIVLSATRTSFLASIPAMMFGLGSLTRLRLRQWVPICTLLLLAAYFLYPLLPEYSLERLAGTGTNIAEGDLGGRLFTWRQGIAVFMEHPFLGVGSGAFREAVGVGKLAHNSFLSVLVELGMIGFLLYALVLAIVIYKAARQSRWLSSFWLTVLAVWALEAASLTLEHRKQSWLFLSLVVVSSSLFNQYNERRLRPEHPIPSNSV
jgi:O-antigen ligase